MTLMEFVGCASLAYGPALALFVFTIMEDPIRIIILIASAFFWLLSLLVSSMFCLVIPLESALIAGVLISVILQEVFRYLIYRVLRKVEEGLKKINIPNTNTDIASNKHMLSFVAGLGFGVMSGAFSFVNILAEVLGPGTMGLDGGSHYFCMVSAIFTLCFILLHTFWSVVFFHAVDSGHYLYIAWVVGSHIVVSSLTLLNESSLYFATILPSYLVLLITGFLALRIVRGSSAFHSAACRNPNIVPNSN